MASTTTYDKAHRETPMTQQPARLLSDISSEYLEAQGDTDHSAVQQELVRFVRWCGRTREVHTLTPLEIEGYSGNLDAAGEESSERLAVLKGFLAYLHRKGWTEANLSPHAKLRRAGRKGSASSRSRTSKSNQLTAEGYQLLQDEMAALKGERGNITQEIRRAAATKDFSENAPLDAAREHQGQVEARIRELEATLKGATILERGKTVRAKVTLGARVVLCQAQSGQEVSYLMVESSEANPSAGKLSTASPLGRAVMDHAIGDEVDVTTPRGAVRYLISKIGN
ncbi:MAG: transcription elongation factor GreA [Dehalococcoidia bacterium]|nr:transcription elongation factor GreA [Dehalococcoidia bacterium]